MNILITGSAGGIGAATCQLLRDSGHTVHEWDLPHIDVADSSSVHAALEKLETEHGPIDALVHAAGTLVPNSCLDLDVEATELMLRTNFMGVAVVCSAVAKRMCQRRRGAIVVVSSNAAATPRIGMGGYGASKAAATAWVRSLGLECAEFGVRCNVVSPGSTRTPMLAAASPTGSIDDQATIQGKASDYRLGIPLQRIAEPQDIASACAFLISDAAKHITMHDLRVDGGATLDS